MKQIIPTILFIISISFIGCDKIEPPYTQNNSQLAERTVLIEKFTGHKCSNCPEASRTVDELKEEPLAILLGHHYYNMIV